MPIVSQAKAIADLEAHLPHLVNLVTQAWDDVECLPEQTRAIMTPRSRSSLVHDHMLSRAASYAAKSDGVRYFERQLMHGLIFKGKYALRFKKLDDDGLSRNHPTTQVTEFRSQIGLEGIDAAHHLEIGYVTNALGTSIQDVRLTCPAGRGNAWSVSVTGSTAKAVIVDIFDSVEPTEIEEAEIAPRKGSADVLPFIKNKDAR